MESQFETQFLALRKKYIEAQFGKLNPVQPAVPAGNWPGPSLPERPHRQVHGGVQRQDKP